MQRRVFVGLTVAVLLLVAGASVPLAGAAGAPATERTHRPDGHQYATESPQVNTPEGFDNTVFEIVVYANGSARWTITHSRLLENESEVDQFRQYAERFNTTEMQVYTAFKQRARALTDFGTDATGRQMNATDFSKRAVVDQRFRGKYGLIRMSFTWTNFARQTDTGVVVDDVFEGGMYVGTDQRLVFENGSNLVFESVSPDPDEMAVPGNLTASSYVEWTGQQSFDDERPKLVFVRPEAVGTNAGATPTPASDAATTSNLGPLPIVLAILLLLALGAAIAWYSGSFGDMLGGDTDSGTAAASTESPEVDSESSETAVPEEELLSDEDRVLQLLEDNGGRMKQVKIVEETDWSKSKVSMLLSDMEEEGLISKLRVGRENIISKAGEEPDAVGSPFDDE